jgi:hypothetical protein
MLLILIHFKYVVNKLVTENEVILIYFNMFYFILFYNIRTDITGERS